MQLPFLTQHNRAQWEDKGHALQGPQGAWVSAVQKTNSARVGLRAAPVPTADTRVEVPGGDLQMHANTGTPAQPPCSVQLLQDRFDRLMPTGTSLGPDWNQLPSTVHVATVHDLGSRHGFKENTQKERDCQLGGRSSFAPGLAFLSLGTLWLGDRTPLTQLPAAGAVTTA